MTLSLRSILPAEALARYVDMRRSQGWSDESIAARIIQPIREQLAASVEFDPHKELQRWAKRTKAERKLSGRESAA